MSDPNYPDDIRMYDNDPSSPFYNGDVLCPVCGNEMQEIDNDLYRCDICEMTVNTEPDEEPESDVWENEL